MLALSVRQPYAELILRGIKTAELRSRATRIVGERFYIYACKKKLPFRQAPFGSEPQGRRQGRPVASYQLPVKAWSDDLRVGIPPDWMIELAEQVKMIEPGAILPTGVIVGSAVIEKVEQINAEVRTMNDEVGSDVANTHCVHRSSFIVPRFRWHLTDVQRVKRFRKPSRRPQPVWFRPF
jgi:predicted transcriptional regulator